MVSADTDGSVSDTDRTGPAGIDAAVAQMTQPKVFRRPGTWLAIRSLPNHIADGERVDRVAAGDQGGKFGLLVLTDRRLLFIKQGAFSTTEDFPLEKIASVQWRAGVKGRLRILVSANTIEIGNMWNADGQPLVDLLRSRLPGGGGGSP